MATAEEVLWEWQPEAIALVVEDADHRLHLTEQGVDLFRSFNYPVAVACLVGGPTRHDVFHAFVDDRMSNTVPPLVPSTHGIYLIGSADFMRTGRCMLALSLTVDLEDDDQHAPLWDLALLLSSIVLYINDGEIPTPPPRLLDTLEVIRALKPDCSTDDINEFLPSLLWATASPSDAPSAAAFHASSWPFELPSTAVSDMATLDLVGWCVYPSHAAPSSDAATIVDDMRVILLHHTKTKSFFGTSLHGDMLVALVDHALSWLPRDDSSATSVTVDFLGGWEHMVGMQCTAVAATALAAYDDVMAEVDPPPSSASSSSSAPLSSSVRPPMPLAEFEKLHVDMHEMAMSSFTSQAKPYKKSRAYRRHKQSLVGTLQTSCTRHRRALIESSRVYCTAVAHVHLSLLSNESTVPDDTPSTSSSSPAPPNDTIDHSTPPTETPQDDVLSAFVRVYRQATTGQVAADQVLATVVVSDVVDLLTRRQHAAKASWTSAHLASERSALQAAYAAKQDQLTTHFHDQALQLREALAAEKKLWTQAHMAKQARDKIDVHETKRLADDLSAAAATIAALERTNQALQDEVAARDATIGHLQLQVSDLQRATADDDRVRSALVDSIAESIRNEKRLEAALAAAESAATAAAAHLRILTEEKEHLQTNWRQLMVQITALPPPLQHQVLSLHVDEQATGHEHTTVGFSDALSSFMST
ncbi:hypothetical protein DYB31_000161 [Aphanomyces astaci]|uniref:Uncharacterized protein n=1 Tax=Aphanomyces astaci TaxID=112090 RepID=A0A397F2N4_APHAT|nr:hypothetical protein DYB31_000161 [Aphanomyces astaci]